MKIAASETDPAPSGSGPPRLATPRPMPATLATATAMTPKALPARIG